ncbi:helix-turn-helix domain-containing protein [Latilactobacillus graminis]|uniref:Mga helix-turn-helix domain-containing protein n=2 Tax=Latilactobacillus graminis TaxID=60519 RepID=A0AA89I5A7_9LACO|nr:helix-turn-helix domain-containing protein [Latilactobacillus graminis]KRM23368.1 hypothetical protein FC90_GL000322 [Latilactobacillus graminis DSM 20719]QFP80281.1 hypothetical protein LG542_08670 [Latilactobacillus graminis]
MEIHNEFLDVNYRYQYYLLELIADNGNYYLTVSKAMKLLGISKFKITQYVEGINADLAIISPDSHLKVNGDGVFESQNINEGIVRKIRLDYLKQSNLFKMLEFSLLHPEKNETADFCEALFIGTTKFYELKKELTAIVEQFNLKFKKNRLVGSEIVIRQFVFEIYYSYFNGIERPFDTVQTIANQVMDRLSTDLDISRLPTTDKKLEIYIKIQYIRMRGKDYLTDHLLTAGFKETQTTLWNAVTAIITTDYRLNMSSEFEIEALLTFLFSEGFVDFEVDWLAGQLQTTVKRLTQRFIEQVNVVLAADVGQTKQFSVALQRLAQDLNQIHTKQLTFYTEPTTFIDENQLNYFAESNPLFHIIIQQVMDKNKHKLEWRKQASIYYDYMFACIEDIPLEILKDRVRVCVDFSQGKLYNQYMQKMVNYFNNLNIEVQSTIQDNTDLYLSDFYSGDLTCKQLIWKNPPTVFNWQQFGDVIVSIKKEKL